MLNCAHPTHFLDELQREHPSMRRIQGVRANASRLSHAELDVATELDRGDVAELAGMYSVLGESLELRAVGGCCGTDHEHLAAIAGAMISA
jgi:S-methylmethionine-dependent homocysteine/selenocysteine methylase